MLMAEGQAMSLDEVVAYALAAEHAESGPARPSEKKADPSRSPLTPREGEVAVLIARGLSNREIAEALFITPRTADTHVMNILTKLGLHSRARVAAWTSERGLLTRGDRRRGDWAAEQEGGFS
jgi:DNA-binding NarL/FixJ family response regulator